MLISSARKTAICFAMVLSFFASPHFVMAQALIGGKSSLSEGEGQAPASQEPVAGDDTTAAEVAANVAPATLGDAPVTCLLSPSRLSNISSPISGVVADVLVKRTDVVQKDQVLVQLDDRLAQSDLDLARISMNTLQEKLARSEKLVETRVISRDEIEALRADYASAEAQVKRAEVMVEMSRITAPFAGVIALANVEKGETLSAAPIIQVIDIETLKVELEFPSQTFGTVSVGQSLWINVDIVARRIPATVTSVDPFLDAASNTYSVLAEVENRDLSLPAGANCSLDQ